ncbi:MAG: hypothetical protein QM765_37770 [Myxococcales bacterium]
MAVDGTDVYFAGVLLDCWERDATVPALWHVAGEGEGEAVLTVLKSDTPWEEPWATAVRAWNGTAFVAGEDGRQASLWIVRPGEAEQQQVLLDGTGLADLQLH